MISHYENTSEEILKVQSRFILRYYFYNFYIKNHQLLEFEKTQVLNITTLPKQDYCRTLNL